MAKRNRYFLLEGQFLPQNRGSKGQNNPPLCVFYPYHQPLSLVRPGVRVLLLVKSLLAMGANKKSIAKVIA